MIETFLSAMAGSAVSFALLCWLLGTWLRARLNGAISAETEKIRASYSENLALVQAQYQLLLEEQKNAIKIRNEASKIAELFALAHSENPDSKKVNQLAWELALYAPAEIVRHTTRYLCGDKNSPHFKEILIDVRRELLSDKKDDLRPEQIVQVKN